MSDSSFRIGSGTPFTQAAQTDISTESTQVPKDTDGISGIPDTLVKYEASSLFGEAPYDANQHDYFSGQLLTSDDLQQEQSYQIDHAVNSFLQKASPETSIFLSQAGQSLYDKLPELQMRSNGNEQTLTDLVQNEALGSARNYANLGNIQGSDIMAVAFIVMMEATKSAQEDLKSIMDGVKIINKAKDGWRQIQDTVNKQTADAGTQSRFTNLISSSSEIGIADLFPPGLDAMHGQPQNYDQLQQVVQDVQTLLNSLPIPNEQKLKIQSELNQLNQLAQQKPLSPQNPDPNFAQALQLLANLRSDLSPYVA